MTDTAEQVARQIIDSLPTGARPLVAELYGQLSDEQKAAAATFFEQARNTLGLKETKRLLELVHRQYAPAFAGPRRISIVGPVNTGKSSLYNALLTGKGNRAEVSPIPGTTREAREGKAGVLAVVDTPGADDAEVGAEGEQAGEYRRQITLQAAREADFLLMVFDASTGITRGALNVYRDLAALGKPYIVALNKIDLVHRQQGQVIELAARSLGLDPVHIVPTSALKGTNLDRLVLELVRVNPELLATLGAMLPQFRSDLAADQIRNAAGVAGTVNLVTSPIPVPFTSFVPITAVQAGLVLSLARLYGYEITAARAKELVATFGIGYGARTLFQQVITHVPGPGWAIGTAIAAATTAAIGYSAHAWFSRRERVSTDSMRQMVDRITRDIVERMRHFGKKRPSKGDLREGIDLALGDVLPRGRAEHGEDEDDTRLDVD